MSAKHFGAYGTDAMTIPGSWIERESIDTLNVTPECSKYTLGSFGPGLLASRIQSYKPWAVMDLE